LAAQATAQTFTTLHQSDNYNAEGSNPHAGLVLSGNVLYGTSKHEGNFRYGVVFAVGIDGNGLTNLHNFIGFPTEGGLPESELTISGNILLGTSGEGTTGGGTVFKVNTDGTAFQTLHTFSGTDGGAPLAGLVLSGDSLYGTALYRGSSGNGTVYALSADGTGFRNLHTFEQAIGSGPYYTNSEGIFPKSELVLSSNTLYGTAYGGGSSGVGTVFCLNTNGTGFEVLHDFSGLDGENPDAGVLLSGNTLHGTTAFGGIAHGTVFGISVAPQLSIVPSGTNAVLTWPTNEAGFDYSGYVLESATNLGSPTRNPVSPRPLVVDGWNTVTNAVSDAQQFFRVRE
jgi:uncharacterized repeat protein (TIGR03803 family)